MRSLLWPGLALSLLLSGCIGSLGKPPPEVHEYRLDYPPPAASGSPLPVVLQIARFRAAAVYARESIVFREGEYETGTYFYHRWIASPASMLADLLARDFAASGLYHGVQQGASLVVADYELSGNIDEIEERITANEAKAHLSLRLLLARTNATEQPLVLQRSYSADEPCASSQPESLAATMSRAAQQISARVQQDVYAAVTDDLSRRQPHRPR